VCLVSSCCTVLLISDLELILKYKEPVITFTSLTAFREFEMDTEEWKALEMIVKWLTPFREATKVMSATSVPTISKVYVYFVTLQDCLRSMLRRDPDTPEYLKTGLRDAHKKLGVYLSHLHETPFYLRATRMWANFRYYDMSI
jgi:hypothetical protein